MKFFKALFAWATSLGEAGNITVEQAWVYKFHDIIHHTYQQQASLISNKISPRVVHRNVRGAKDTHERLDAVIGNDQVVPFGQTKILNPGHSRRSCTLQSTDAAVLVSDEHTLRSMVEPTSPYTEAIVMALGRRVDKHYIDACVGAAETGIVDPATAVITFGSTALDASHIINPGSATTAIDNATINQAHALLTKASVPVGASERIMLYHPGHEEALKAITQASSSDFTKNMVYDKGSLDGLQWNGFTWVCIADVVSSDLTTLDEMLPSAEAGSKALIAVHNRAVGVSIARDIETKINERPDLTNSIQIRSCMMQCAVRLFEGGVVRIDAAEQ